MAAYFADALRREDPRFTPLPGAPGLSALAGHARDLARRTEDEAVERLATAVDQARGIAS
ncbi:hypothetical protein GCM10020295_53490 [Streptomyces cinereospinus]